MGVAQAGIAFRPAIEIADLKRFVSDLLGDRYEEIPHPNVREFDIRHAGDVMVQDFGGAVFICSDALAWRHLEDQSSDLGSLHQRLGSPAAFMIFCNYGSGGSYGYALVENGLRRRSRLQTTGVARLPPLLEHGQPTSIEQRWLSAKWYLEEDDCPPEERQRVFYLENPRVEVAEYFLTQQMLGEILKDQYGVCPWDTTTEPIYHFFRVSSNIPDAETEPTSEKLPRSEAAESSSKQRRPWWQFFRRR